MKFAFALFILSEILLALIFQGFRLHIFLYQAIILWIIVVFAASIYNMKVVFASALVLASADFAVAIEQ